MDNFVTLRQPDFEEAVRPLMKWLNENANPHTYILITQTSAELIQSIQSTGEITEFLKD